MRLKSLDYSGLRKVWRQWRQVAPNYYGDYYPLTAYSMEKNVWMAWQFDRPEVGEGVVQAFRRAEAPKETVVFKLHGVDPQATYLVTNVDVDRPRRLSGIALLSEGLPVTIMNRSEAVVFTYRKVK